MPGRSLGNEGDPERARDARAAIQVAPEEQARLEKHEELRRQTLLPQKGRGWVPMREEITIFRRSKESFQNRNRKTRPHPGA